MSALKYVPVPSERLLPRRVENHMVRGQLEGVFHAFQDAVRFSQEKQFSNGFVKTIERFIRKGKRREAAKFLHFLGDHPSIAQLVLPVQRQDPQMGGKLAMLFFAAAYNSPKCPYQPLANNAVKDFTPDLWDDLIANPSLFDEFASGVYQTVAHRNDMLDKFHKATTNEQFLTFCKNGRQTLSGASLDSNDISQLVQDRAEFLDKDDQVKFVINELIPAWIELAKSPEQWPEVYIGLHKAAHGKVPHELAMFAADTFKAATARPLDFIIKN